MAHNFKNYQCNGISKGWLQNSGGLVKLIGVTLFYQSTINFQQWTIIFYRWTVSTTKFTGALLKISDAPVKFSGAPLKNSGAPVGAFDTFRTPQKTYS